MQHLYLYGIFQSLDDPSRAFISGILLSSVDAQINSFGLINEPMDPNIRARKYEMQAGEVTKLFFSKQGEENGMFKA